MADVWRLAKSLIELRNEVNAKWPARSKSDDGTIGDAAHAARTSDHNPDDEGVVRAMDLTHDPAHGFDSYAFAEKLRLSRDPRIKYVISNRRIFSATKHPWEWGHYDGENAHDRHVHTSVVADNARADLTGPWGAVADSSEPSVPPPLPTGASSGRGSWYSQFTGKYHWIDNGDAPGSSALGVPDNAQGVSFYDRATLGKWFLVTAPNGHTSLEQQTDIGPAPFTGRKIDISSAAAERFGYSPSDFPTNGLFLWKPTTVPPEVAALADPKDQGVLYRARRTAPVLVHDMRWLQQRLLDAGVYHGGVDGDVGPLTIAAMIAFAEMFDGWKKPA